MVLYAVFETTYHWDNKSVFIRIEKSILEPLCSLLNEFPVAEDHHLGQSLARTLHETPTYTSDSSCGTLSQSFVLNRPAFNKPFTSLCNAPFVDPSPIPSGHPHRKDEWKFGNDHVPLDSRLPASPVEVFPRNRHCRRHVCSTQIISGCTHNHSQSHKVLSSPNQ